MMTILYLLFEFLRFPLSDNSISLPGIDDNALFLGAIGDFNLEEAFPTTSITPTSPTSPDPESEIDNDKEVVRRKMLNGCGCKNVNHFDPLTVDDIYNLRLNMRSMTINDRSLCLLAMLQTLKSFPVGKRLKPMQSTAYQFVGMHGPLPISLILTN